MGLFVTGAELLNALLVFNLLSHKFLSLGIESEDEDGEEAAGEEEEDEAVHKDEAFQVPPVWLGLEIWVK